MSQKKQETRKAQRQARREERRREEERQRAAKKRGIIWTSIIVGVAVVVIAVIITSNILGNKGVLASDNPAYPVVDNTIACQKNEQFAYHVHAHLSIYMDGQPVSLPANVGIASDKSCIYWLHTHDVTGVIHVESPTTKTYSLGTFFNMWQDYFSQLGYPSQVNTTEGWQVYIDGKPFTGDFHTIELLEHRLITIAYNSPNIKPDTPDSYSWPNGT
jgi:hypothetical protein